MNIGLIEWNQVDHFYSVASAFDTINKSLVEFIQGNCFTENIVR